MSQSSLDVITWAENNLQLTAEAGAQLYSLPEAEQRRILVILRRKLASTIIHNVSSYLMGVIKKEMHSSPAPPAPMTVPAVNMGMPANLPPVRPPVPAPVPVRPQAPHQLKRPYWVMEAWPLVGRPQALIKKMVAVIGPTNVSQLSQLPLAAQMSLLTNIIISPEAWQNPAGHFADMMAVISGFPSIPGTGSQASSSRGAGDAVVVLQFGQSLGFEFVAVKHACGLAATSGGRPFRIVGQHSCALGESNRDEAALLGTLHGNAVTRHQAAEEMAACMHRHMTSWCQQDVRFLILMTFPARSSATRGAPAGAEWHRGECSVVWEAFNVLRLLGTVPNCKYAFLFFEPSVKGLPRSQYLDDMFGTAWEMDNSKHKVPVREWFVRSWPALMPDVLTARVTESSGTDFMHADLLSLQSGTGNGILVPDHVEFEEFLDKRYMESEGTPEPDGWQRLISQGGPTAGYLLNRKQLAHIWGIDGWGIDDVYDAQKPCFGSLHWSNGLQCAPDAPGAVRCGQQRFCMSCDHFYAALHRCAPAHGWSMVSRLLAESIQMTEASGENVFAKLPQHVCDGLGCSCF